MNIYKTGGVFMIVEKPRKIEYICTWCGQKVVTFTSNGRPQPGYCPRKPRDRDGKMKPHTWTINKRM